MTPRTFAPTFVARSPDATFAVIIRPTTIPMAFKGKGPIPGTAHAEVLGDATHCRGSGRRSRCGCAPGRVRGP